MDQFFQRLITFSATGFAIGTLFGTAGAGRNRMENLVAEAIAGLQSY